MGWLRSKKRWLSGSPWSLLFHFILCLLKVALKADQLLLQFLGYMQFFSSSPPTPLWAHQNQLKCCWFGFLFGWWFFFPDSVLLGNTLTSGCVQASLNFWSRALKATLQYKVRVKSGKNFQLLKGKWFHVTNISPLNCCTFW